MRPYSVLLLLRCGVAFLPESVWNGAGISHASNPSEVLSIDNTLYSINTCLEPERATHSLWQGFGLTWDETSGETNGYLGAFHWRR
jgi:hypothetical protein